MKDSHLNKASAARPFGLRAKFNALCIPFGTRKASFPLFIKCLNENRQKSLYQSRNCFITDPVRWIRPDQFHHHLDDMPRSPELTVGTCRSHFGQKVFIQISLTV